MKLDSFRKGSDKDGDCGYPSDVPPAWLDMPKFRRGQQFFIDHASPIGLALHFSLTVGFAVINLLKPLVFTRQSDTPEKAYFRYFKTFLHLTLWHMEDPWVPGSKAHRSVQMVRKMHRTIGKAMTSKLKDKKYVSQYDMAVVQCGFFSAVVLYPEGFGIKCTTSQLEDYIHFWKGIGYLLGIDDRYNICTAGNYKDTYDICKEIEQDIVRPGLRNPPKDYDKMSTAYIDGMNLTPRFRMHSREMITTLSLEKMEEEKPAMSWSDTVRMWFFKAFVFFVFWIPGCEVVFNKIILLLYKRNVHIIDEELKKYS